MTGSSDNVGPEAIGLVSDGTPQGTASPVAIWQMADVDAKLPEAAASCATDQPQPGVLAIGVETL